MCAAKPHTLKIRFYYNFRIDTQEEKVLRFAIFSCVALVSWVDKYTVLCGFACQFQADLPEFLGQRLIVTERTGIDRFAVHEEFPADSFHLG